MEKKSNIVDKFFQYREEKFIDEIEEDINLLSNKIKDIKRRELTELVDSIPKENFVLKEKLINSIDNLIVDYNIMLAYYNKKYYKQGFEDAVCLEKEFKRR